MVLADSPALARSGFQASLEERAAQIQQQMQSRGEPPGEINLALAALYARARREQEVYRHIQRARRQGISAERTDLLLGTFFSRVGRFDAAFSTLVRLLVRNEEQPYALVQLWKTLYQAKLQGTKVKTDTDVVRERLAHAGLQFPQHFKLTADSASRARELTAAGYNAILADRNQHAAGLFEAAIDAMPSNPLAHRGLGIARARMGDFARAAGAYLIYLELRPDASDGGKVDRALMEYWKNRYASP